MSFRSKNLTLVVKIEKPKRRISCYRLFKTKMVKKIKNGGNIKRDLEENKKGFRQKVLFALGQGV